LDEEHAEIVKAIVPRDPAAARKAANLHLGFVQASLPEVSVKDAAKPAIRSKQSSVRPEESLGE
jgi:DNA-binding FadR family transcriptional regulator